MIPNRLANHRIGNAFLRTRARQSAVNLKYDSGTSGSRNQKGQVRAGLRFVISFVRYDLIRSVVFFITGADAYAVIKLFLSYILYIHTRYSQRILYSSTMIAVTWRDHSIGASVGGEKEGVRR